MQKKVFISHASEDKPLARYFADTLKESGLEIWFDQYEIRIGDSIRRKIEQGLSQCDYGLVILSQKFLSKEWPQKELDGLVALTIANSGIKILPVWHNIGFDEIVKRLPSLADTKAASTEVGISECTRLIIDSILSHEGEDDKISYRFNNSKYIVGSDPRGYKNFDQIAVVCYKIEGKIILYRLVNTSQKRWTFPKGGIRKTETVEEAIHRIAIEEAGCKGAIYKKPIRIYKHLKRDLKLNGVKLRVIALLLKVNNETNALEKERNESWFSYEEALLAFLENRGMEYATEFKDTLKSAKELIARIENM